MTTLPKTGTRGRVECHYAEPLSPTWPDEFKAGWEAFWKGEEPAATELAKRGWEAARGHQMVRESYDWTVERYEDGPDGERWAVCTRTEPRSLDDVYNGTGTGLGTETIREWFLV